MDYIAEELASLALGMVELSLKFWVMPAFKRLRPIHYSVLLTTYYVSSEDMHSFHTIFDIPISATIVVPN